MSYRQTALFRVKWISYLQIGQYVVTGLLLLAVLLYALSVEVPILGALMLAATLVFILGMPKKHMGEQLKFAREIESERMFGSFVRLPTDGIFRRDDLDAGTIHSFENKLLSRCLESEYEVLESVPADGLIAIKKLW